MQREAMEYDVVIVGGGPAGLAAAIRLKQIAAATGREISVCLIEKGSEIGAHILSGAVLEPRALDELLPDWKSREAPLLTKAADDRFLFLTERRAWKFPTPPQMHNHGNFIVSLGNVVRWLGRQAEELGVEIYAGFAGAELLFDENGRVAGVATGDMGIQKDGSQGADFQPGMELRAPYTLFAEGCRGSLTKQLEARFGLRQGHDPQTYAIGIKELWELPKERHHPGRIIHTIGWPLSRDVYGGTFMYHWGDNFLAYGMVIGLDYANPYLSPFEETQRFKTHPEIRKMFEGAKRIGYGARALNEGGFQSIPGLVFPGGAIIGDSAGFLNVPKIKGTHTAMKSGMCAAEALAEALAGDDRPAVLESYPKRLQDSWVWPELRAARNIRPGFKKFGFWGGLANAAFETYVTRGHSPWTLHHHADHEQTARQVSVEPIAYPRPDGVLTFDRLSSVFLSNTNHEEDQPAHLVLRDPGKAISVNWNSYASPETRYCPAGVYELVGEGDERRLQINAQNCVHCKTCDIKDPTQNIDWVVPQGGGGPNYVNM
jgi:electron-transferring-flavoprotein dehydrogenase